MKTVIWIVVLCFLLCSVILNIRFIALKKEPKSQYELLYMDPQVWKFTEFPANRYCYRVMHGREFGDTLFVWTAILSDEIVGEPQVTYDWDWFTFLYPGRAVTRIEVKKNPFIQIIRIPYKKEVTNG